MADKPIVYDLRKQLGARAVFGPLGYVEAVTLHHTVTSNPLRKASVVKLIEQIDDQHRGLGWGGIGYHYVIDRLGRVYKTRSTRDKGAHTARRNTGNIGVAVLGNYVNHKLSDRQRKAVRYLVERHDAPILAGHREWPDNPTACPGRILDYVKYLRDALGKRKP